MLNYLHISYYTSEQTLDIDEDKCGCFIDQ